MLASRTSFVNYANKTNKTSNTSEKIIATIIIVITIIIMISWRQAKFSGSHECSLPFGRTGQTRKDRQGRAVNVSFKKLFSSEGEWASLNGCTNVAKPHLVKDDHRNSIILPDKILRLFFRTFPHIYANFRLKLPWRLKQLHFQSGFREHFLPGFIWILPLLIWCPAHSCSSSIFCSIKTLPFEF